MPLTSPLPRTSIYLEGLRVSLALGAAWDLLLAAALLVGPEVLAERLDLPHPGAAWFLPFVAVLLAGHALGSLVTVTDPFSYRANALFAAIVRLARAAALAAAIVGRPGLAGLLPLVVADGLLGTLHAVGWWRALR